MGKKIEMVNFQNRVNLDTRDKKIKTLTTPFKFPIGMAIFNNYFYFPKKIPQLYDVYHISNQTITKCCKFVKPSIVTCHDIFSYYLKETNDDVITTYFLKKHLGFLHEAEKIISVSNFTKQDLIKFLNIPEEKIKVINPGINANEFKPRDRLKARKILKLPIDKKIILHVGKDFKRKNVGSLIKIFFKLEKKISNAILVKVGGFSNDNINLIKRLGLEHKIKIFEAVTPDKLALLYNAADVFVFPSFYEGFGLPPLEAMASGLSVILSNTSALPEVVGDAEISIDPLDLNKYVDAVFEVLTDEKLQDEMIKKGLKRVKEFSWKTCARETWKTYEEVCNL
jgi:glycosyltransferase involved in cell wall biosynthesis